MDKKEELIMVVRKEALFGREYFQGFKHHSEVDYELRIRGNIEYIKRKFAEENPEYKQPIVYCLIVNSSLGRVFAYQRSLEDSMYFEKRLQGKWSWGVGGHIGKQEAEVKNPVKAALLRELDEEVGMNGKIKNLRVLGYINDDSDDVGKVHFGVLYVIETDSSEIKPKDKEIAHTKLMTIEELESICSSKEFVVERWSRISLEPLKLFLQNMHDRSLGQN